jgi:hypothetical protein
MLSLGRRGALLRKSYAGQAGAPSKPQDKNACTPVLSADYAALVGTAAFPPLQGRQIPCNLWLSFIFSLVNILKLQLNERE